MADGVSVVICCHNSSQRLPETLAHLAAQQVPPGLEWEVVVVDNASTDDTARVARHLWPSGAPAQLRVVAEPRAGLTHARHRGLAAARFDLISFIDDDNWVCPDWVRVAAEVMERHPQVAACGGSSQAVCEGEPPAWFSRYQAAYAVGAQQPQPGPIEERWGVLWGAGLTLRRSAWCELRRQGFHPLLTGRQGIALTACEDDELSMALRLAGWRLWYEPRLSMRHYLPAGRLQWRYLRRMKRGIGASSVGLDPYRFALADHPFSAREQLRQSWSWQILSTLKALAPLLCTRRGHREGDAADLRTDYLIGRLRGLMRSRPAYGQQVRNVLHAPWLRTCPRGGRPRGAIQVVSGRFSLGK